MSNLVDKVGKSIADEKTKARVKDVSKAFLGITAIGLTIVVYSAGVYGISTVLPPGAIKVFGVLGAIIPGIAAVLTGILVANEDI